MRELKKEEQRGVTGGQLTKVPYYNSDGSLKGYKVYENGTYKGYIEWSGGNSGQPGQP